MEKKGRRKREGEGPQRVCPIIHHLAVDLVGGSFGAPNRSGKKKRKKKKEKEKGEVPTPFCPLPMFRPKKTEGEKKGRKKPLQVALHFQHLVGVTAWRRETSKKKERPLFSASFLSPNSSTLLRARQRGGKKGKRPKEKKRGRRGPVGHAGVSLRAAEVKKGKKKKKKKPQKNTFTAFKPARYIRPSQRKKEILEENPRTREKGERRGEKKKGIIQGRFSPAPNLHCGHLKEKKGKVEGERGGGTSFLPPSTTASHIKSVRGRGKGTRGSNPALFLCPPREKKGSRGEGTSLQNQQTLNYSIKEERLREKGKGYKRGGERGKRPSSDLLITYLYFPPVKSRRKEGKGKGGGSKEKKKKKKKKRGRGKRGTYVA